MKNLSRRELLQSACTAAVATTLGSSLPGESTTVARMLNAEGSAPMNAADYLETADGTKIYYEDHGEGQPILLVHGWMCSSRFWRKNVAELASSFRVVTFDLRGHGNSAKTLNGQTIRQYARDVREVIERLGLQETLLAGSSLGGAVVLSYYEQFGGASFPTESPWAKPLPARCRREHSSRSRMPATFSSTSSPRSSMQP